MLPLYRDDLIRMQGALRDGSIKRIDFEIEENRERQGRLTGRIGDLAADGGEDEIRFLDEELEKMEISETALILERADAAGKEIRIKLLLEFIDILTGNTSQKMWLGSACCDYNEFFQRTRYRPKAGLIEGGKLRLFDNDLVVRYLESVVVKDDGYEVVFKAGFSVFINLDWPGCKGALAPFFNPPLT